MYNKVVISEKHGTGIKTDLKLSPFTSTKFKMV
jgi:hypothetical protein